ncbi:MAG: hypothetical protein AAFR51_09065 [Pseudomonadota bacterium]
MIFSVSRFFSVMWLCAFFGLAFSPSSAAQDDAFIIEPIRMALPLATVTSDGAGCKSASELQDENARAYAKVLEARFNADVTLCLTETYQEAVQLAAQEDVNFVWSDQDSAQPLLQTWRPILTLRGHNGLGRVPFVVFGLPGKLSATQIAAMSEADLAFLGRPPKTLNIDLARQFLGDFGVEPVDSFEIREFSSINAVFDAVETGTAQAGILEGGTWGRTCNVLDPTSDLCDHLEVLIYDRPRAVNAFLVPNDVNVERHYRFIGVQIALHLEHPDAFQWLSQGEGSEYDPTEPAALQPKSADSAIVF